MVYTPSSIENRITGVVGLFIFLVLFTLSIIWLLARRGKSQAINKINKSTKSYFTCIMIMSLFELPRYLFLAIQGSYTSRTAYCCHIVGGIFFFVAFSILCRQWSGLLRLGAYFRVLYGIHGLVVSNLFFATVDIIGIIACASSPSLESFFVSIAFTIFTFIEGCRNVVYSVFLTFYGLKLISRFWYFSNLERQQCTSSLDRHGSSLMDFIEFVASLRVQTSESVFKIVVVRVTFVLLLCTACFLSRVSMLVAKMAALHSSAQVTSAYFSLFGLGWFVFADFVPRALPSLACLLLLSLRRPGSRSGKGQQEGSGPTNFSLQPPLPQRSRSKEFQFVRLAKDELDLEYSCHSDINPPTLSGRGRVESEGFSTDPAEEAPPPLSHQIHSKRTLFHGHSDELRRGVLQSDVFVEAPGAGEQGVSLGAWPGHRSLLWAGDEDDSEDDDDDEDAAEQGGVGQLLSLLSLGQPQKESTQKRVNIIDFS
mmetsp:Transcript_33248/g.48108  ORF Transcript_33248/g.48108 Transcript_33248/m.48108 type:complete len:482 (-) Transcript_33248:92-1537(-)